MRALLALAMAAPVATLAACGVVPGLDEVRVHVDNETDIPIGVYVDGVWRGTDEPGATIVVPLGDGLPPITIEARSASGAVLATLDVPLGPVKALRDGEGDAWGEEIAVPCGLIRITVGELGPNVAHAPAAAVPAGPCT